MKILLGSDLHLEFKGQQLLPDLPEYDVVVLAGDIGSGVEGFKFAMNYFPSDKPVLYIPGNHEYYGKDFHDITYALSNLAKSSNNVHLIDFGNIVIDGINFIGTTLWTNFKLNGYKQYPLYAYKKAIGDFNVIRYKGNSFGPEHSEILYREGSRHIKEELEKNSKGRNVVVTHFMPSQEVITPFWKGNSLNPYFCNDMDYLIDQYKPELWLYGHTHDKGDKLHSNGKTRLVANPRGYPKEKKDYFKWKILEI